MANNGTEAPEKGSIEYALQAFTFANIRSAAQIRRKLDQYNISWEEFDQWVRNKDKDRKPNLQPMPEMIRVKLEKSKLDWDDFSDWIDAVKEAKTPADVEVDIPGGLVCPDCGSKMEQTRVNTTKCNQVGGEWKSIWNCPACGHDKLDRNKVKTKKVGVKRKARKPRSVIVDPKNVRMLYYRNPRRRLR